MEFPRSWLFILSLFFIPPFAYSAADDCPASSSTISEGNDYCIVTDANTGTKVRLNFNSGFDSSTLIENDTSAASATDTYINDLLTTYSVPQTVNMASDLTTAAATASKASGNNGTTVGAQRKLSFIKAAEIVASRIVSAETIVVDASFSGLTCFAGSATLGSAGATNNFANVTNNKDGVSNPPAGALANTFYPIGLLNALGSDDYDAGSDVTSQFNINTGTTGCLESSNGWYYGFDAPPTGEYLDVNGDSLALTNGDGSPLSYSYIGFTTVLLHEITHGLGFASLTNASTGAKPAGIDDIFSNFLYSLTDGADWKVGSGLTDGERAASAISGTGLLWNGSNVNTQAAGLLTDGFHDVDTDGVFEAGDRIEMYAPNPVESGSSVSHFNTDASPNEIMEPQYTEGSLDLSLAIYLMQDLGWSIQTNTNPTITAVDQSTDEDTPLTNVDASGWASDGDGDSLTFSITSCPSDLTCNISSDGTDLDLTPDANYNGATNSVTIQVNDGNGGITSDTFNVTVNAVDDAPSWSAIPDQTVTEGGSAVALDFSTYATDVDGDSITGYSIVSCGTGLDCSDLSGSTLNIQATSNGGAIVTVTVRADEGDLTSDTSFNVIINSAAANNAPTLTAVNQTTDEDTLKLVDARSWANDTDGDTLTFSVTNCPSDLTCSIDANGNNLSLTPSDNFNGVISNIEITVDDGNGGTANDSFDLTVTAVNDAPVMGAISDVSMSLGDSETIALSSTDIDSNSITYSVSGSANAGASITGSTLTLNPIAAGNFTLQVTANDGELDDSESFNVTVVAAPSLALNGSALDSATPAEIELDTVSLLLNDGVSGYTISLTFEGQSANQLLTTEGTNIEIAMPDASDFSGQFAGEYVLTLDQISSGVSTEYTLLRSPRLVLSAAKLLANSQSQTLTIEGGAANTLYTLSNNNGLVGYLDDGSSTTTINASSDSASFNAASVTLSVQNVSAQTETSLVVDSIYESSDITAEVYPRLDFELQIEDAQSNRLTEAAALLQSPDLSDFNLPTNYTANSLGVIAVPLPDVADEFELQISQVLYVTQTVTLTPSLLNRSIILARIATPLTLSGDIQALSPLSYEQTLPTVVLNLEDGTSVDIEVVKISNTLARFEYVHDLNTGDIASLVVDHADAVSLSFTIPNIPGEVLFDVFLEPQAQSPTLSNEDATEIGSSSGGTLYYGFLIGLILLTMQGRPMLGRRTRRLKS